ncbi:hypothetical protein PG984_005527 [Apiospora sp. TS-2023a]
MPLTWVIADSSEDRAAKTTVETDWSVEEERRLVRKLDFRVLFPCCLVYFFAYLDRANIGNVKILQSETDDNISKTLHLAGRDFNWTVSVTYISVMFFIIPSNLIIKRVNAKRYLPVVMVLFGTISMCMATSKSSASLFAARFFLGFPESGVVPACILYFSFWYKPVERAWRVGVFFSANALSAGCSGFIAVGIDKLNGQHGLASWQWVVLIEGAITVFMAIPVYYLLLTFPETSMVLSERQRYIAINRLAIGTARQTDKTWDWVAFMGFSPQKANSYVAIVYFYMVPLYWFWPLHSDWTRERMWHYVLPAILAIPCYAVWTWASAHQSFGGLSNVSLYGLMYLGQLSSIAQPVAIAYRSSTLYGASEQAVGGGIQIGAIFLASILSPQLYPDYAAPWYLTAFTVSLCLLVVSVLVYLSLPLVLLWEAKRRKARYGHAMPRQAIEDAEHSRAAALHTESMNDRDPKPGLDHVEEA